MTNAFMESDIIAKKILEELIPFLSERSEDVIDEYNGREYIPAVHGAVHDLGIIRADLPESILSRIESLVDLLIEEGDAFNKKFISDIQNGICQLNERKRLKQRIVS